MAYSALLDANVLHPIVLCDLLLRLAERGLFRPLWSSRILDETTESILRRKPDLGRDRLERRIRDMEEAFPEASVAHYEHLEAAFPLAAEVVLDQSRATRRPHHVPRELLGLLAKVVPEFAELALGSPELARLDPS